METDEWKAYKSGSIFSIRVFLLTTQSNHLGSSVLRQENGVAQSQDVKVRSMITIFFQFCYFFCTNLLDVILVVPQCDPPKIPDSAVNYFPRKMKKKFKYNARVLLKCKAGYFKSSGGVLTCKGTNRWTGDVICSRKFS